MLCAQLKSYNGTYTLNPPLLSQCQQLSLQSSRIYFLQEACSHSRLHIDQFHSNIVEALLISDIIYNLIRNKGSPTHIPTI